MILMEQGSRSWFSFLRPRRLARFQRYFSHVSEITDLIDEIIDIMSLVPSTFSRRGKGGNMWILVVKCKQVGTKYGSWHSSIIKSKKKKVNMDQMADKYQQYSWRKIGIGTYEKLEQEEEGVGIISSSIKRTRCNNITISYEIHKVLPRI